MIRFLYYYYYRHHLCPPSQNSFPQKWTKRMPNRCRLSLSLYKTPIELVLKRYFLYISSSLSLRPFHSRWYMFSYFTLLSTKTVQLLSPIYVSILLAGCSFPLPLLYQASQYEWMADYKANALFMHSHPITKTFHPFLLLRSIAHKTHKCTYKHSQ